ncbi:helix-turn-helix domain-containing protein [Ralstonia insidiosa]|uniref:Helix-turn-helix transcriptional regulator n=1 Tax=Ralstonia insidiosa TaxID=190721 RepID=A0A848NV37_9RALS|nr:helix-turn-helix transcriptional regulator [Ralstonia insidiosa]NMV36945.1 helix-turn-helix transcriptional regulator [Ralstonia insidiosa]
MSANIGESIDDRNRNIYGIFDKNSDMEKLETLGARLRWARNNAKMSQTAAAKAVGLKQPTLSDLENDNTKETASLIELADLYGVSARWLKSGRGDPVRSQGVPAFERHGTGEDLLLSLDLARQERARLLGEQLLDVSSEMRALIDKLLLVDREGGATREMTIAGVGYILQSVPVTQAQKKVR